MKFIEDPSKTLRQNQGIEIWRQNKGIGTHLYCPRFGKTQFGVTIANKVVAKLLGQNITPKVLILTPSEYICRNWRSYWDNYDFNVYPIKIVSINYYLENTNLHHDYDLVIVDEVHKFLTDIRYAALKELRSKSKYWLQVLGLLPPEKDKGLILDLAPIIDVITDEEAIKNNWIAPSINYNVSLTLSDEDKIRYIKHTNIIGATLELFKGIHHKLKHNGREIFESDFDAIYACFTGRKLPHGFIEGKVFREMVAQVMGWSRDLDLTTDYGKQRDKHWNPNHIYEVAKTFQMVIKTRNEIIANNDVKLDVVVKLINKYNVPTIVFNESIDFVTKIADALGKDAIAYHSKIESRPIWDELNNDWFRYKSGAKEGEPKMFGKDKIKQELIEGMLSGKYKYLITAKALDEGLDIPNLELVIITAGSTNPLQQGQRSARGNTIDINNTTKQTKIFNLYFDDIITSDDNGDLKVIKSRDKAKLMERQVQNSIELLNIDEIS